MFHERQPHNAPRWIPFGLETQVDGKILRYRVWLGGHWYAYNVQDIVSAQVIPTWQWSWPVSVNISPSGSRIVSTSGRGVLLKFSNGKQLLLGSQRPEELLKAIQNR